MMSDLKRMRTMEKAGSEIKYRGVIYPYEFDRGSEPVSGFWVDQFNPIAYNLRDMVSAKQSVLAKSLALSAGLDENDVADQLYGCEFGELSKTAAGLLIEYLEDRTVSKEASLRLAG